MGFLGKLFSGETNEVNVELENSGVVTTQAFNGYGKQNRAVAEKISALTAGVGLIADSIASLPVYKYKINSDGSKTKVKVVENYLLNSNMNDYTNAYNGKNLFIKDAIFSGNGYILIERDEMFKVKKLIPLENNQVQLLTNDMGKTYYYQITLNGKTYRKEYYEIINLCNNSRNGIIGQGILSYGCEVLGIANSQNKFQGSTLENGAYAKGILYVDGNTNAEQRNDIGNKIKSFFSKGNSGRLLVLPNSSKYEGISLSPSDLDLLKSQEFTIQEIARLLKIRPELLGASIGSGNYKNLEESNLQFLTYTLQPYLANIEATLNHYLLTEAEKISGEYCYCFDLQKLLRTDIQTQADVLDKFISGGVMTIKEARDALDLPYIEGTDILMLSKFNSTIKEGKIINIQSMKSEGNIEQQE
jgi:HK97 family phage portal protein